MKEWLVIARNEGGETVGTYDVVQVRAEDARAAAALAARSEMGYAEADSHVIVCPTDCAQVFEIDHPRDLLVGAEIGLANLDLASPT